jgi:addiction module HigA family antidote
MENEDDPFSTFIEWNGENDQVFDDLSISSEDEYIHALAELKKVWGAQKDTPEGRKLNALVNLIVAYEEEKPLTNEEAVEGFVDLNKPYSVGEVVKRLFISRRPTPPSEIVQEEFLAEGFDKEVVREKIGFTSAEMDAFLAGEISVTADLAHKLSATFGTSKELWLNLQRNCDVFDHIKQQRKADWLSFAEGHQEFDDFPDREQPEMQKREGLDLTTPDGDALELGNEFFDNAGPSKKASGNDTAHLLSSTKNAERLQASIQQLDYKAAPETPLPRFEVSPITEEDGGGYLISFPDYPGCIADGETAEEAIAEGRDALQAYLGFLEEVRKATKEEAMEKYQFEPYVMEIEGYKATIAFDPEINMFRGEFIDLGNGGGADFYSKNLDRLEVEGKISLEVYFDEADKA